MNEIQDGYVCDVCSEIVDGNHVGYRRLCVACKQELEDRCDEDDSDSETLYNSGVTVIGIVEGQDFEVHAYRTLCY